MTPSIEHIGPDLSVVFVNRSLQEEDERWFSWWSKDIKRHGEQCDLKISYRTTVDGYTTFRMEWRQREKGNYGLVCYTLLAHTQTLWDQSKTGHPPIPLIHSRVIALHNLHKCVCIPRHLDAKNHVETWLCTGWFQNWKNSHAAKMYAGSQWSRRMGDWPELQHWVRQFDRYDRPANLMSYDLGSMPSADFTVLPLLSPGYLPCSSWQQFLNIFSTSCVPSPIHAQSRTQDQASAKRVHLNVPKAMSPWKTSDSEILAPSSTWQMWIQNDSHGTQDN